MESSSHHADASARTSDTQNLKRIRKGTKSCIECRQRKIRCVWQSSNDKICAGCKARGRECIPQIYQRRSINQSKLTSRDRISRLEAQIASLTSGGSPEKGSSPHIKSSPADDDQYSEEESDDQLEHDEAVDDSDDHKGNYQRALPTTIPPTHFKILFENALIDPDDQQDETPDDDLRNAHCSPRFLEQSRAKLQRLMPTRQDVAIASGYGDSWMSIYLSLFPSDAQANARNRLMTGYDSMLAPDAHPVHIAYYLATFAISIRQMPESELRHLSLKGFDDMPSYAHAITRAIEQTIISHSGIASTVAGVETTVMYIRLQLGSGLVRPLWLTLRRTVAIAELIGLHRAGSGSESQISQTPSSMTSLSDRLKDRKVKIWDAIVTTDRMASMMFNLPAATSSHRFARRPIVDSTGGEVVCSHYMFEIAGIAMQIHEIDESVHMSEPRDQIYAKVLSIERHLRSLKTETSAEWWVEDWPELDVRLLIQFWHYYLTTRLHLHLAIVEDEHNEYSYSRTTCTDACESMARRYSCLRRLLPQGFFVSRIIDLQVFTAAAFLTLSCVRQRQNNEPPNESRIALVELVISAMESIAEGHADFAREAASAMRALLVIAKDPSNDAASSQAMTIRIPLIGKIRIGRKKQPKHEQYTSVSSTAVQPVALPQTIPVPMATNGMLPQGSYQNVMPEPAFQGVTPLTQQSNMSVANTLPWLMELDMNGSSLQDPFLQPDYNDFEQQWWGMGTDAFGQGPVAY